MILLKFFFFFQNQQKFNKINTTFNKNKLHTENDNIIINENNSQTQKHNVYVESPGERERERHLTKSKWTGEVKFIIPHSCGPRTEYNFFLHLIIFSQLENTTYCCMYICFTYGFLMFILLHISIVFLNYILQSQTSWFYYSALCIQRCIKKQKKNILFIL